MNKFKKKNLNLPPENIICLAVRLVKHAKNLSSASVRPSKCPNLVNAPSFCGKKEAE